MNVALNFMKGKYCLNANVYWILLRKYLPNMNVFGDWLTRAKVIIVFDSLFRKLISIGLFFHCCNEPITKPFHIRR